MSRRLALCLMADGNLVTLDEEKYDEIDALVGGDGNLVWLDVGDPTPEDIELLKREFDMHELAIEDLRKRRQRP
ncbi:MAG TPA: hypothetical protein VHM23_12940, partial [Actinomycetota bacterium]|nr:hypothetical protein [Actinomycetota bacterium]